MRAATKVAVLAWRLRKPPPLGSVPLVVLRPRIMPSFKPPIHELAESSNPMPSTTNCKVAFKSGDQYLMERPQRGKPIGTWTRHLTEALLFDGEVDEAGRIGWPWHLSACGDYSDGGQRLHDRFCRYMFPGGCPTVVVIDLVERREPE